MYRKIAIAGATAAVIVGAGTAALAASAPGTSGTPGAPSPAGTAKSATAHARHGGKFRGGELRRILHGEFVTKGKDGTYVTHDVIHGQVSSVSATSIVVTAPDKTSETFAVTKDTKVRLRPVGAPKPAKGVKGPKAALGTISEVHQGDTVFVLGTGSGTLTATRILDAGKS
ncbi:MAG: hypothetical protein ACR2LF_10960 [Jatrophihabitantaceae bacterium]